MVKIIGLLGLMLFGCSDPADIVTVVAPQGIAPDSAKTVVQRNGTTVRFYVNGTTQAFTNTATVNFSTALATVQIAPYCSTAPLDVDILGVISNVTTEALFWEGLSYEIVSQDRYIGCKLPRTCTYASYQEVPQFGVYVWVDCTTP